VLIYIAENRDRLKSQLEIIPAEETWCVPAGNGLQTTFSDLMIGYSPQSDIHLILLNSDSYEMTKVLVAGRAEASSAQGLLFPGFRCLAFRHSVGCLE